jgi:iron complex outermembrane recepter protein
MSSNPKLTYAIAAILSSQGASYAFAAVAAENSTSSDTLAEVVVTAQRRSENIQDVPIAIQALTSATLTQLNVTTFDDYIKYIPNVTSQGLGPGQNNIYMRGLSTAVGALQGSGVVGTFPNVAVYLDDQSVQLPGRNLDIYAADLERIEVLEGPQGTLFGAGAQAGVVRYITNKPKLDKVEANFNVGYATTVHGGNSNNLDATLNVPLIADTLAVRAVVYNDSRGGYISNIPGTFARSDSDLGIGYAYNNGKVPLNSVAINNTNLARPEDNPVVYKGIRVAGLWKINDDWNALIVQSYQDMKADGVFAEQQFDSLGNKQPDLTVQLYNPSFTKDKFTNTSWTINGRIGPLKAVYTGGYLARNVEQIQDYTNYARGPYVDYYQCAGANPVTGAPPFCATPSATWHDVEKNTHKSHEFRLSTPDDWRVRGIFGLFWEDYKIGEVVDWNYKTATDYFTPIAPTAGYFVGPNGIFQGPNDPKPGRPYRYNNTGVTFVPLTPSVNDPSIRNINDGFFDDIQRGYKQKAAFLSVDFDLVPHKLTLTAGTRYFKIDNDEKGSVVGSFGCKTFPPGAPAPNPCRDHSNATNLDSLGLNKSDKGFKSRANLTWKITSDALVYATWSQGFRAGGFNRPNSIESGSPLKGVFAVPIAFDSDNLVNKEIGWKSEWLNHRLQINGAVYQEDWKDAQVGIFAPGLTGNLTFTTNGADFRSRGVEITSVARVTHGLTVTAAAAWNSTELTRAPQFNDVNGNAIDWSKFSDRCGTLRNPFGEQGDPLAGAPPFQGNIRLRYEFAINDYQAFWQIGATHQGHSLSSTDRLTKDLQCSSIAYDNPQFSSYDASVGVAKDAWAVQLYAQNIDDTRGELYANARQWYKSVTVTRPRTIGLRLNYKF